MSTNLYEILGVSKNATTEEIRKAYKKQALKTHPDKLQPGLSEEVKAAAAEKFRKARVLIVAHACEILTDAEKRKEYDAHGVWPPPESDFDNDFEMFFEGTPGHRASRGGRGFSSPFFTTHRHRSYSDFVFRDPFELFDAIFRDFDDIFGSRTAPTFAPLSPFGQRSFGMSHEPLFPSTLSPIPSFPPMLMRPTGPGVEDPLHRGSHYSQSERYVSQTVNGITQSTHIRRDQDGNEHITRKYSDGREVYTINGVEQPARGYLPANNQEPRQLPPNQPRHRSTLPTYPQPLSTQHHQRSAAPYHPTRHATYTSPYPNYHDPLPPYRGDSNGPYRPYPQASDQSTHHDRERRATSTCSYPVAGDTQYNERWYKKTPHLFRRGG
ncbi:Chaperone protein DnaJ [Leucoagaricus sp. SymC.cos]|nr:Chaperone protein DnaJ [Leucoagaricus sp. SymC.cos]